MLQYCKNYFFVNMMQFPTTNQHPTKFGGHWCCESADIKVLQFSRDQVIKRSYELLVGPPAPSAPIIKSPPYQVWFP